MRLLINGTKQGNDQIPYPDTGNGTALMPRQCQWNVTWATGTVTAEGLDANGNVVCTDQKVTAGAPACVALTVASPIVKPCDGDTFKIYANGSDAAFILATIVDAQGNWCPTSTPNVTFSVSGPGNYRGGADNNTSGAGGQFYHSPGDHELTAEGGMCKVAVRSTFTAGTVTVNANSPGLCQGTATFTTLPVPPPPPVAVLGPKFIQRSAAASVQMRMIGRTLRYFLNVPATVSFDILDAGGRVVRHVARFRQTEGWHPLMLGDGTNGASGDGVYFVRCSVDQGSSFVKRVVVIR